MQNIQSTAPKIIILGLDEGLEEGHVINQAEKLKMQNPFISIKVGYIWDKNNEVLKKGSKMSPMDVGKIGFEHLMRNCTKWI